MDEQTKELRKIILSCDAAPDLADVPIADVIVYLKHTHNTAELLECLCSPTYDVFVRDLKRRSLSAYLACMYHGVDYDTIKRSDDFGIALVLSEQLGTTADELKQLTKKFTNVEPMDQRELMLVLTFLTLVYLSIACLGDEYELLNVDVDRRRTHITNILKGLKNTPEWCN